MSAFSLRSLTFAAFVASVIPATAAAQAVADLERRLLPLQSTVLRDTLSNEFWAGLSLLRAAEDKQRALKGDVMFGLAGDEAGPRSLFKLNTGITLTRGDYPTEISVISRFGLQLRDGQLQEDVTSLKITYDYHLSRRYETFAFAERFTDSFLSIQQRYEIGFGGRIGKAFGYVGKGEIPKARAIVGGALAGIRSGLASSGARTAGARPMSDREAEDIARAVQNIENADLDASARVFVGLAASVFAELERAEIEVVSVPASGPTSPASQVRSRVTLESEQRYRMSIRPTLKLQPHRDLKITVFPYFKLPLDGPSRDYRRDIFSEAIWSLKQDQTGLENVDVIFAFNHFYDNVPPSLPQAFIDSTAASGRVFVKTEAEKTHRLIALTLRLRW